MRRYQIGRFETHGLRDTARGALVAAHVALGAVGLAPVASALPSRIERGAGRWWARTAIGLAGIRLETHGMDLPEPGSRYLVTPLHEGFADAVVLADLPIALRFVARDELFDWPLLGRALRFTGQILVRPERRIAGMRKLLSEVEASFAGGESVVMFPQGSILGIETAFQMGPFRIADKLGVSVLPVVITGTHRVWEHPYSDRLRFGQAVEMTVMEPLAPGSAVGEAPRLERRMKEIALHCHTVPPRRFEPERDGFWDGYEYEIDPSFPELARRISAHRSAHRPR